jgi:hypothetical protein
MRNALLAFAALAGVLALGAGTANARDYRFCLKEGWEPGPGTCYYNTYAQCMASAAGRNAYCQENPQIAFARQYGDQRRYRANGPY